MSFINTYQYEQYSQNFDCPDGENKVRIDKVDLTRSKAGNDMLEIRLSVQGSNGQQYIERYVDNEYFNKNMSRFFDAFTIQPGNFDFNSWLGHQGKGFFEHAAEKYTDNSGQEKEIIRAKMKYLITPENKQHSQNQNQNQRTQNNYQRQPASPTKTPYQQQSFPNSQNQYNKDMEIF